MPKPKPAEELTGFSVRPRKSIHEKLKQLAKNSGMSLNEYVISILEDAVEKNIRVEMKYQVIPQTGKNR